MNRAPLATVFSGWIALIIFMGIGRFAYTPILPLMQQTTVLSHQSAAFLATANYFGYLGGAFIAGILSWKKGRTFYLKICLFLNGFTTMAIGLVENIPIWLLFRLISEVTSGIGFVFASSIVFDALIRFQKPTWSGLFYSGVGSGIFFSSLLLMTDPFSSWSSAWIGLGFICLLLMIFPFLLLKNERSNFGNQSNRTVEKKAHPKDYFCYFS